ncbi:hypothetical protein J1614_008603, partial [Plenodomus biglobosus]
MGAGGRNDVIRYMNDLAPLSNQYSPSMSFTSLSPPFHFIMPRLVLLRAISHAISVAGYCYTRNGSTITSRAYQPCNNTTSDSACCGTNHVDARDTGVANDVCKENGLCQNFEGFDGSNEGQRLWWRQGCTDPTWQRPYCLSDVCNDTEFAVDNAPVRNRGGNNWCCGKKNSCIESTSIFQLAATVGPTSAIPSTPSVIASSSASATTSPGASTAPAGRLSTGSKGGIGVGAAVLVVLTLTVAIMLLKLRRSKGSKTEAINEQAPYAEGPIMYKIANMRQRDTCTNDRMILRVLM